MLTRRQVNWLVVFTIFATPVVFFRQPFEFYLFYIPILFLFPFFIRRYTLSRDFLAIMMLLGIAGFYGVLVGANTLANFFKIYISIVGIYSFYYYAFAYNKFEIDGLLKLYTKFCYVVALIGVFQLLSYLIGFVPGYDFRWILNKWTLVPNPFIRINSIISEPSQLAFVLSPVIFISIYNLINKKGFLFSRSRSLLFIAIVLLTFSTHAYIILLASVLINLFRRISVSKAIVIVAGLIIIISYIYGSSNLVRERIDDSILVVKEFDRVNDRAFLASLNTSSFTLLNNYIVTMESFKRSPIVGGGLGSHPVSFEKYSLTKSIYLPFLDFNKADANSLFLRLISETGLLGITLFLFMMIKFRVRSTSNLKRWIISHSIFVMMIAGFLREGHYFHSGVPFFIFIYIFNYRLAQKEATLGGEQIRMGSSIYEKNINYGRSR